MKTNVPVRLLGLWLLPFALRLSALAQGTAITYQGSLHDGANPATGSYDLRFTLHDAATNGNSVGGVLTNSATAISNGLFTATLDFGASVFTGGDRWLEMGVRTNGGGEFSLLTPRQPLTATPYAVRALEASSMPAANLTGTIPVALLPATVITNGASGVAISGTFSGNGAGVTNVSLGSLDSDGAVGLGGFRPASSPVVGSSPYSVTAADVNGDGWVDLISANQAANTLTVLTNNRSGGFVLSSSPVVGNGPTSVTAADVNVDGWVDLISANQTANTLTVLTNNRSGGFVSSSSPGVGPGPNSVTAADVNGDGKADLISANFGHFTLTVLTNNGSGGFVFSSTPVVGNSPASVIAMDVNGDAKADLISANYNNNTLTVLTNNGSGGFVFSSTLGVGNAPALVIATDVNGDGRTDLVSANFNSDTLTVLTNNGSGGFALSSSPAVGDGPQSVAAADVNGDGRVDLISANFHADALTVLTNNGSGGFALQSSLVVGDVPRSVTAADVNRDTLPDLVSANAGANALTVLWNSATFTGVLAGDGSGLTALNAASLTSGTVADARLSANVALLNRTPQSFAGTNSFAGLHVGDGNVRFDMGSNRKFSMGGNGSFEIDAPGVIAGRFVVDNFGRVGIGRVAAANKLEVEGNASKTTSGSWLANSDARIKRDIEPVTAALDTLNRVRLVSFRYEDAYTNSHRGIEDRRYLNVVAQEFAQVFPEHVKPSGEKMPDGSDLLQVDIHPLTIYSAAAIQELNRKLTKELNRKDTELTELKQTVNELKELVQALNHKLNGGAQ